jgi:hypothetical protein
MTAKQVFKREKGFVLGFLILLTALAVAFVSGFAYARATERARWVGRLVTYQTNPFNDAEFRYSRNIVLGLRNDGVVVWKKEEPR